MNEIIYQKSYQEYKAELDGELQRTAEGFVRIGYLLKVARDTNVLAESGYKTVAEFAESEYNLNKTQVSRFININDKFSEGGYSDHLMEKYQGYGYAKLTIMLQLPDAINEELSPNFSKTEIQAVKDELDEEQKVSDIERYIEETNEKEVEEESILHKAILQLGEDDPELYVSISERKNENLSIILPEIMAPAGEKIYSIRVRGIGRLMLSISELNDSVKVINTRTGEKESYTWDDVAAGWISAGIIGSATENQTPIECWEQRYERKYPIAPVQQPVVEPKKEKKPPKKENKVKKATKDWPSKYKNGQQIKVISNGHIGELLEKTEKTGQWNIQFPRYKAEMKESQFTEYVDEVIEDEPQLHDHFEEIPETSEKIEPEEIIIETQSEAVETIIPGQMNVSDYPEILPDAISENENAKQEFEEAAVEILDEKQILMIKKAELLINNIKKRNWIKAIMDIEELNTDIVKARDLEETDVQE